MKRAIAIAVLLAALCAGVLARGETVGFGSINADAVNIRKSAGGDLIFRAEQGQNVFVFDSETDAKGQEWYRVVIYRRPVQNGSRCEGWVMAKFVDVTDADSCDITKAALNDNGYMALHADGTVSGAEIGFFDSEEMTERFAGLNGVRDIGVGLRTYAAAKEDGALWQWGIRKLLDGDQPYTELPVRLIASDTVDGCVFVTDTEVLLGGGRPDESRYLFEPAGIPHVSEVAQAACFGPFILLLNTQGELSAGTIDTMGEIPLDLGERTELLHTEGDWTGLSRVDICKSAAGSRLAWDNMRLIGARIDGTAIAWPETLQAQVADWTGLTDVKLGEAFALGLREDGTVLCAGDEKIAAQVRGWENVASIEAAETYCAAVTEDGRILFAGQIKE